MTVKLLLLNLTLPKPAVPFFPSTTTKTKSQVIIILPPFSSRLSKNMRTTLQKKKVLRSKYESHENQYENRRVAGYKACTIPLYNNGTRKNDQTSNEGKHVNVYRSEM